MPTPASPLTERAPLKAPPSSGLFEAIEKELEPAPAMQKAAEEAASVPVPPISPPVEETHSDTPKPSQPAPPVTPPEPPKNPIAALLKKPSAEQPAATDTERDTEVAELTKGLSEKAADKFKAIHKRAYEAEQKAKRVAELEKQVSELKKRPGDEEITTLKTQLQKYDEIIRKTNLAQHPDFVRQYQEPVETAIKAAKMVVGAEKAAEIETLMRQADSPIRTSRLESVFEGLSNFKAQRLASLISQVDQKEFERQEALSQWQETEKQYREQESARANQLFRHTRDSIATAAEDIIRIASDQTTGVEVFFEIPDQPEWNQEVKQRREEIRRIATSDLSPQDLAELAMQSVAARKYRDLFLETFKENSKLQKEIETLKAAEPGVQQSVPEAESTTVKSADDFISAVDKAARAAGLLR